MSRKSASKEAPAEAVPAVPVEEAAFEPIRILIVDDEPAILEAVTYNLRQEGYDTLIADDAEVALRVYRESRPQLVILDVMLPSGSGFDICRLIRQSGSTIPILMLTARVSEADRVQGLEIGADDYLVKPFGMRELMARVKALLRRGVNPLMDTSSGNHRSGVQVSQSLSLTVDIEKREVWLDNVPLALSRKEFDVLALLTLHSGRVFDRQTLLDRVWGQDAYVDDRTVDVHMRWLREKIEPVPGKPVHLLTVRGVGYKFQG